MGMVAPIRTVGGPIRSAVSSTSTAKPGPGPGAGIQREKRWTAENVQGKISA